MTAAEEYTGASSTDHLSSSCAKLGHQLIETEPEITTAGCDDGPAMTALISISVHCFKGETDSLKSF
jgi:hypothetical protein